MKKRALLCLLLLVSSMSVVMANAESHAYKRLLLRTFKGCKRIKSGHYDIICDHKFPFQAKVESITGHCIFSKVPTDQVLGGRVDLTIRYQDGEVTRKLYDGRYDVSLSSQEESRASVSDLQGQQRTHHIAGNSASWLLFEPLLPVLLFSKNNKHWFQRTFRKRVARIEKLPDETIDDRKCSVFVAYCRDRGEIKDEVLTLFIDHTLNIPIKYVHKANYWGSPTYTEATISNFMLNYQEDPGCVPDACALIPEGYEVIKDHELVWPQQELLSVGTVAPLWELSMVQGGELSLAALRGKVVLLSFWYKSFGPSLQYLQALQEVHEKFQKQGLVVVGINLYDPCEELTAFLQERGITYSNLLGDEQVTKAYQAHTPNTFYLLDQSGKVCYGTIAQGDFPQKVLCKKINQLLKESR